MLLPSFVHCFPQNAVSVMQTCTLEVFNADVVSRLDVQVPCFNSSAVEAKTAIIF